MGGSRFVGEPLWPIGPHICGLVRDDISSRFRAHMAEQTARRNNTVQKRKCIDTIETVWQLILRLGFLFFAADTSHPAVVCRRSEHNAERCLLAISQGSYGSLVEKATMPLSILCIRSISVSIS